MKVAKLHSICEFNNEIPLVKLSREGGSNIYAVININQVTAQVGLVKTPENINTSESDTYRVISPYYIFENNLNNTAGQLSYL